MFRKRAQQPANLLPQQARAPQGLIQSNNFMLLPQKEFLQKRVLLK